MNTLTKGSIQSNCINSFKIYSFIHGGSMFVDYQNVGGSFKF